MLPKWSPLHWEPEPEQKFAFCEAATAGGSRWHIRELTRGGKMLGGGADTPALCGRRVLWGINTDINEPRLQSFTCPTCAQIYRDKRT